MLHLILFLTFISFIFTLKSDSYCITSTNKKSGTGLCLNGDIFLKSQYIELGVNNMGSFGTNYTAPSNFYYYGKRLGFIADYDKNGFSTSSPGFAGDYFVPGVPLEGNFYSFIYFISLFFIY